MKDLTSLNKEALVELVCEMEEVLLHLEDQLNTKKFKVGRKDQVLDILKEGKLISVKELAERVGITNKNVSSQLTYLRNDGWIIGKVGRGVGRLKLMGHESDTE